MTVDQIPPFLRENAILRIYRHQHQPDRWGFWVGVIIGGFAVLAVFSVFALFTYIGPK